MIMVMTQHQQLNQAIVLRQLISQATITPDTTCPNCGHVHTEKEIRQGWRNTPYDFTTKCVNCKRRFVAGLDVEGDSEVLPLGHYQFLCPEQLYTAISDLMTERGRSLLGTKFLLENQPELFWNIIRHHGNYERGLAAFKRWQSTH